MSSKADLINHYIRISSDAYLLNVGADIDTRFAALLDPSLHKPREAIDHMKASQYRKPEVIDSWTPFEIALFIAGITRFGRDWERLKSLLPSKSAMDLSQFYYSVWKGSRMYSVWKKTRKQRGLE